LHVVVAVATASPAAALVVAVATDGGGELRQQPRLLPLRLLATPNSCSQHQEEEEEDNAVVEAEIHRVEMPLPDANEDEDVTDTGAAGDNAGAAPRLSVLVLVVPRKNTCDGSRSFAACWEMPIWLGASALLLTAAAWFCSAEMRSSC